MNETTTTATETPAAATADPAPKAKSKKAAPKKAAKKPAKKVAKKSAASKERPKVDTSISSGDRRKKVVQALRSLSATVAASAVTLDKIASKSGLSRYDVYGAVSGHTGQAGSDPRCLLATGIARTTDAEDGLSVYLTSKGKEAKFDTPPFVRSAAAE